jgi:hypothetical protein
MFDDRKDAIDRARRRFDSEMEHPSPDARRSAEEYMHSLEAYLAAFDRGPAADPRVARVDTTGMVEETEQYADWVWTEAHRVREAMRSLPD